MKSRHSLAAALLLAACGGGTPAPTLYHLGDTSAAGGVLSCHAPSSIAVSEALAAPGLDSARMVVHAPGGVQTYYSNVRWSATAPVMVQHYFADALERSGAFAAVSTDDASADSRWLLETQLRDFEIDQSSGQPVVRLRITAMLVERTSHRTVKTVRLETERPAAGADIQEIVRLFDDGLQALSMDLLQALAPALGCRA